MRGSVTYQVHQLFEQSGINRIGQSKHVDKEAVRKECAARGEKATWHDIGQKTGIYSYSAADLYRDVWAQTLQHAKSVCGIRDIEKITPEVVRSFLEAKISDQLAYSSFRTYTAGIEKLAVALSAYASRQGRDASYDFHSAVTAIRQQAKQQLAHHDKSRAYERPSEIVKAVANPVHQLAARVQAESGARVHEISLIKREALLGIGYDRTTREELGFFQMSGKGGKEGIKAISVETYRALAAHIANNGGAFRINEGSYRDSLRRAADKSGQEYQGSHGLRWNWAQERYQELQQAGLNGIQALFQVSQEMGHERGDITLHYLRT